jgi:hypothetical protein
MRGAGYVIPHVMTFPVWRAVGSYGTRNIVVIGMMVFGATDRVYCIDLSKFYSSGDPPFKGGFA